MVISRRGYPFPPGTLGVSWPELGLICPWFPTHDRFRTCGWVRHWRFAIRLPDDMPAVKHSWCLAGHRQVWIDPVLPLHPGGGGQQGKDHRAVFHGSLKFLFYDNWSWVFGWPLRNDFQSCVSCFGRPWRKPLTVLLFDGPWLSFPCAALLIGSLIDDRSVISRRLAIDPILAIGNVLEDKLCIMITSALCY